MREYAVAQASGRRSRWASRGVRATATVPILQELGDRDGEGATWDSLGRAHQHLGDHPEAIACFRQALRLRQERGDSYEVAETLRHLGDAHLAAGDRPTARLRWQQALELLDQLGHNDAPRLRARLREPHDHGGPDRMSRWSTSVSRVTGPPG
ncbi:tetratricopeptide repeat protein [Streptomyces phyllanthi]|uniref:Tetratricopeptide repeat protein n=1 Tax=Streptomyces phyllanthi TaxID=1803180 RepID=A0A5N8WC65_9ACTN|nr:tetratricopeptide repeat protein [Streptomyces phyllanthi]